jgi:hypothetical protein
MSNALPHPLHKSQRVSRPACDWKRGLLHAPAAGFKMPAISLSAYERRIIHAERSERPLGICASASYAPCGNVEDARAEKCSSMGSRR